MAQIYRPLPIEAMTFEGIGGHPRLEIIKGSDPTNPIRYKALLFDASNSQEVYALARVDGYGSGDLTVELDWYADAATTGNVHWEVSVIDEDPVAASSNKFTALAYGAGVASVDAASPTSQELERAEVVITAPAGIGSEDFLLLRIRRDGVAPADTMAGDAVLVYATLKYSDS